MNERYAKQIKLPQVGSRGQEQLAQARVLCVGAGGLGSPVLLYLSAAGIGYLDVIDPDQVDLTNLQRQVLFKEEHLGLSKARVAADQIMRLNSNIRYEAMDTYLGYDNAEKLIPQYDLIIDGSDNFETKLLLNDACYKFGIPWVYAGVSQFEGQVALFKNRGGACYRCLFSEPDKTQVQSCEQAGVLGSIVGILGSCQATIALQHLLGLYRDDARLQVFDFLGSWNCTSFQIPKRADCLTCSRKPEEISLDANFVYLDVRTQQEWDAGHRPGAIHWPLDRIERGEIPVLPAGKSAWRTCCQTGYRAAVAAKLLKASSLAEAS